MRVAIIVICLLCLADAGASADVEVRRYGAENPMVTIAKSMFWGGLGGLLLGGAVALIADDNKEDYVKWGFVGGVFVGLGVGIYHVVTRPQPTSSLIRTDGDNVALSARALQLQRDQTGRATLRLSVFAYDF